ncbi:MAG TPA: DUF3261 domain-containing protein [Candidatus Binatia bacterium]|nr:DUF3261 domain-containing protein [Candidatus Binatia bacterium]
MRLKSRWLLAAFSLCALGFTGCASALSPPGRLGLKLAPAALEASISLHQQLVVERLGRIDSVDAALEVDAERLDLVGLTLGQRVFALHYDGRELQSWRHPSMPAELRGEDVLEDLQLTLWPASAIKQALPEGWRIEEMGRRRTLWLDETPVMMIDYSGEPRWLGRITVNNLRYQYRLIIFSISSGS